MANTKVTGDLIASLTIATGNIADNAITSDKISGLTTAHITEGANLYYTDARARAAVSVSGNALSYNSSTGVITSNFEESPTFTGIITASSSSSGDYVRLYGSSGTGKWDIYGNGANLRISDNESAGILVVDTDATFGGEVSLKSRLNLQRLSAGATTLIQFKNENGVDRAHIDFGGTNEELSFFSGAGTVENMRIDNSGNIGIGVTPWVSTLPNTVIDINPVASIWGYANSVYLNSNGYYNNGWLYKSTASAGVLQVDGNILRFRAAASGTAGAGIAFDVPFIVDSTGNVGIGTTSPNVKLQITGNSTNSLLLDSIYGGIGQNVFFNGSAWDSVNHSVGGSVMQLGTDGSFAFRRATAADPPVLTYSMYIDPTGKVGIGTTSPGNTLDVAGDTDITGQLFVSHDANYVGKFLNTATSMSNNNYALMVDSSSHTSNMTAAGAMSVDVNSGRAFTINGIGRVSIGGNTQSANTLTLTGSATEFDIENTSGKRYRFNCDTSGNLRFEDKTGGTEVMRFASSNNVGIGTTSPGRKLTVTGDVSGDANNLLLSNENDTDGDSASIGFSMLSNNTYVKSGIFFERTTTQGRGSLHLAVNNEVNGNNVTKTDAKLTINNSGKVGIGTTAPSEMLHINGSGSGPEIRLQGTWGSHYIRAYNDNWNFLVGGTVQAINIKNNGNISMSTSNNGSKLNVGGTIAAATNDLSSGMIVPRSLGVTYGGSTFTYTFNPVTLFGMGFRGGQVLFECTGWLNAMNNGYIMWRNAGGSDPIGTNGSVQYVQTAYVNGGQSGSNTIAVSLTSGTNDITITFTGWHGNSHGFMCRITTNYS